MSLPMMFPEEFVGGYLGTVRQFLSLRSNDAAIKELHQRFGPDGNRKKAVIDLLSIASAQSKEDIVAQHTLVPLSRAFAIDNTDCLHGADKNETRLRVHSGRFSATCPQYCPHCIDEDLNFWGVSYWRRYHLIHGIGHCLKHQAAALIPVTKAQPFAHSPDYHFSRLKTERKQSEPTGELEVHEFVKRYADICAGLLETKQPIGRAAVTATIRYRAKRLGLRFSGTNTSTVAHDLVKAQAPQKWLLDYFPKSAAQKQSSGLERNCLSEQTLITSESLILVCAALYESANEALTDMHQRRRDENSETARRKNKVLPPGFWVSQPVLQVYEDSGYNTCAVAKHFGLTDRATRDSMEKRGYPGIYRALKTKAGQALQMFLTGTNLDDALRHAGDEREDFEKLLLSSAEPLAALFRKNV